MKKYILPIMGIAMSLGFSGFVAYATVRTAPVAFVAEGIEGGQEQMLAGVAGNDTAIAPVAATTLPDEPARAGAEVPGIQSEAVVPSPAVISPPAQTPTQPDEPVTNSRYEDDDGDDEDEDD